MGVIVFNKVKEEFSTQELIQFVSTLSSFHRIQGSDGIEEASDYIYEVVKELKSFNVNIHSYSYLIRYGNLSPLIGWWVKEAELRIVKPYEKLLHTFRDSRTLVVAHSPGGKVSAEVTYVGLGDRPRHYEGVDVEGKVVLASGNAYLVYREACKRGAAAVLLFREDTPEGAVPYASLFLTPDEVSWARIPALSISRKVANELLRIMRRGDRVLVSIDVVAGFRDDPRIKVITARLGEATEEVHVFSHYCHPGGMINDNVSGAATLLAVAKALDRALAKSTIPKPKHYSLVMVWYPEYYGPHAYLGSRDVSYVTFGVNLDMIGEKQEVTGSTVNFVRPPPSLFHPLEANLYYWLREALSYSSTFSSPKDVISYRFDVTPYEVGSDHDIYIHLGIPAVMINQWPDKYYHTDMDTVDKFDSEIAKRIGLATVLSIYSAAINGIKESVLKSYVLEYIGSETLWVNEGVRDLRFNYLCKVLYEKVVKYYGKFFNIKALCTEPTVDTNDEVKYVYRGVPGVVELRTILRLLDANDLDNLERLLNRGKYVRTLLTSLIPLLLREPKTLHELRTYVVGELGVDVDLEVIDWILKVLTKVGYVELINVTNHQPL